MAESLSPVAIVKLDVSTAADALELVDQLADACRFYKVGNELFTAAGPAIVRELRARGCDVFLDLKFHDIPNTVAGGVRSAVQMGARLVTVHASGGPAMLEAAAKAAGDACGVLAVTVLTSMSATDITSAWGRSQTVDVGEEVMRLAGLAAEAGVHGVVCGGPETAAVTRRFGARLAVLVPGLREKGGAAHDQARVITPGEAAAAGARYVIIGRMVTEAADRRTAMAGVLRALTVEGG